MDVRAKAEGSSKKRRRNNADDNDEQDASQTHSKNHSQNHSQSSSQVVPRNKIHSALHGIPDKTEYVGSFDMRGKSSRSTLIDL